jgi:hypothetical protein
VRKTGYFGVYPISKTSETVKSLNLTQVFSALLYNGGIYSRDPGSFDYFAGYGRQDTKKVLPEQNFQ